MRTRFTGMLILALFMLSGLQGQEVLPAADFSTNFCNFPFAWQHTRGENVEVVILSDLPDDVAHLEQQLQKLAPGAKILSHPMASFLNQELKPANHQVLFIASEVQPSDLDDFLAAAAHCREAPIVMPAYFGPMDETKDYTAWQDFVVQASRQGVIIIGSHGDMYQLGDLSFWSALPIDFFAVLGRDINGFQAMATNYRFQTDLERSACLGVAAVALVKSHYPLKDPQQIRQLLREKGRKVYYSLIADWQSPEKSVAFPHFERNNLGQREERLVERNILELTSLDLMVLFGHQLPAQGGWCLQALEAEKARQKATGKKTVVAILDHSFNKNHPVLKDRYVAAASMIEGVPALSEHSDHGTYMAEDVLLMAPDALILPVVVAGNGQWGQAGPMILGIRHAVENGADVISCSQGAIQGPQDALDEAIQEATRKGVTFVFINYGGNRQEVIIPSPIEFARYRTRKDHVYLIGTNFIDNDSPITWGVSHTAPIVSGVIALMREVNPHLVPAQIKQILLQSTKDTPDGVPLLDAHQALVKALP